MWTGSGERESAVSARAEKARESTAEYVRGAHEGARVEERTLHERHVLARHERHKAVEQRVDALQGSRDSFPVFLFIWVIVQMLVGRRLSGIK